MTVEKIVKILDKNVDFVINEEYNGDILFYSESWGLPHDKSKKWEDVKNLEVSQISVESETVEIYIKRETENNLTKRFIDGLNKRNDLYEYQKQALYAILSDINNITEDDTNGK